MGLLGEGVLAFWHGVEEAAEEDFLAWHVREHIPERVGLPGFLRGRRYVAVEGQPKFFNFYEAASIETFRTPIYRERLNNPSPWTRQVVGHFRDTTRTVCKLVTSMGCGEGAWVETIRLGAAVSAENFREIVANDVLPGLFSGKGIAGVHFLEGIPSESRPDTAEKALRSEPDRVADWILLVEAVSHAHLTAQRTAAAADVFKRIGAVTSIERGIYQIQFSLGKADLAEPA
ncbi:DUF4286 family protein [Shumkonia mesophila]|uniref:DUF4286 family protein n=1 Tax=Shumkonia mesophila TaxID=2838854 RepID=UPI0029351A8F|nr:DUF4286 family protein [Shumkonia mesophila]